jgi:cell division septation protein DedD
MRLLKASIAVGAIVAAFLAGGCSGSKTSSTDKTGTTTQTPPETAQKGETGGAARADTFNVKVDDSKKPPYEQSGQPGNFAVQIGAYTKQDNADRAASLARERFSVNVSTIVDKTSGLFKVLVGNFPSKDEARKFRDDMVQKFPADYKDAWTTDIPQR